MIEMLGCKWALKVVIEYPVQSLYFEVQLFLVVRALVRKLIPGLESWPQVFHSASAREVVYLAIGKQAICVENGCHVLSWREDGRSLGRCL